MGVAVRQPVMACAGGRDQPLMARQADPVVVPHDLRERLSDRRRAEAMRIVAGVAAEAGGLRRVGDGVDAALELGIDVDPPSAQVLVVALMTADTVHITRSRPVGMRVASVTAAMTVDAGQLAVDRVREPVAIDRQIDDLAGLGIAVGQARHGMAAQAGVSIRSGFGELLVAGVAGRFGARPERKETEPEHERPAEADQSGFRRSGATCRGGRARVIGVALGARSGRPIA